jgi:hypothetical protein
LPVNSFLKKMKKYFFIVVFCVVFLIECPPVSAVEESNNFSMEGESITFGSSYLQSESLSLSGSTTQLEGLSYSGNFTQQADIKKGAYQDFRATPYPGDGLGRVDPLGTYFPCSGTKPGGTPKLLSAKAEGNSIILTWSGATWPVTGYIVAYGTSPDLMEYGNPNVGNITSYTVQKLSGGTTYYFKIKSLNGCMSGDFSNVLSATLGGVSFDGPATNFAGLFDIKLTLDKSTVTDVGELGTRVTLTNFGVKEALINLTFTIKDANGKVWSTSTDNISVQTEKVFDKKFSGFKLPNGKYTLTLNTLYNTNVEDEFKQDFIVKTAVAPLDSIKLVFQKNPWLYLIVFLVAVLAIAKRGNFLKKRRT